MLLYQQDTLYVASIVPAPTKREAMELGVAIRSSFSNPVQLIKTTAITANHGAVYFDVRRGSYYL